MTSATWDTGSLAVILRFRVSSRPVTRCLRLFLMGFVQKRRLSTFFQWLIIEKSQNWPDLRSLMSNLCDDHFIDTVTHINRWKVQGDRSFGVGIMTSIQTFSEVRSFNVTWWPDLEWPGSEIFTTCAKRMYEQVYQKWRRCAPPFLRYLRKSWGGVKSSPARPGLKVFELK